MHGYPSRTPRRKTRNDLKINMMFATVSMLLFILFVFKKTGMLSSNNYMSALSSNSKTNNNQNCWSVETNNNNEQEPLSPIKRIEKDNGRNIFVIKNCKKEKGLLVLLHGCSRLAASFFYSPEGLIIVKKALKNGLSIAAITKDDERGCWNLKEERLPLIKLINNIRKDLNLQKYPLYGFGASSGGAMMTELTTSPLPFCAVNIQISPVKPEIAAPAAIYTFMKDDLTMFRFSKHMMPLVLKKKTTKLEIISIEKPILNEKYFSNKIKGIDMITSTNIFHTLKNTGMLAQVPLLKSDVENNFEKKNDNVNDDDPSTSSSLTSHYVLKDNPRIHKHLLSEYEPNKLNLQTVDDGHIIINNNKKNDKNDEVESRIKSFYIDTNLLNILTKDEKIDAVTIALSEELNVLYNQHEIVATKFERVLTFFDENNNNGNECKKSNHNNLITATEQKK